MSEQNGKTNWVSNIFYWLIFLFVIGLLGVFAIPNRVGSHTSPINACINNLRQIDAAKQEWRIEHKKTGADIPNWDDVKSYLGHERSAGIPKCPLGGIYTLGALSNSPTCSIPGHVLP